MGAFSNMDYELQNNEAAVSDAFTEDDAMDKFAAMNLKKLATWKWRNLLSSFRFAVFSLIYVRDPVCS